LDCVTRGRVQGCCWLGAIPHKGQLELHYLPSYAPDLNPDEFVWNHLRHNGITKTPLKKNEQLKARRAGSCKIKRSPRLVRSFFRAESVGYITD
jgi:transposase